jgi:hypothetical protein
MFASMLCDTLLFLRDSDVSDDSEFFVSLKTQIAQKLVSETSFCVSESSIVFGFLGGSLSL